MSLSFSLRTRLIAAVVGLAAVGLIAADIATAVAFRSSLMHRVDLALENARDPVLRFGSLQVASDRDRLGPTDYYAEVRDRRGRVVWRIDPTFHGDAESRPNIDGLETIPIGRPLTVRAENRGDAPYRVLASHVPGSRALLIVGISLREVRATMRRLLAVEVVATIAILAAIAALAMWVVRMGLRPLTEMEAAAVAIAGGDLSQRVQHPDDGTEVGRLAGAFNRMVDRIEVAFGEQRASEDRLRRFVADASHELRTPLTSIRGYAELFRQGAGERPEDLAKSMGRIEQEAGRMGVLVEDLLLLARLDQGRPLDRTPVDLSAIFADAADDARAVEPDRPITFDAHETPVVSGDADRLRQVAANLLGNAREHTPRGTPVHVRVSVDGNSAIVEVSDEGPGMDAETASRVFERFFRADPSRARVSGGSGLGLSIVAAIVEAHDGTVSVRSEPGAGATFVLEMPLATARKRATDG